MDTTEQYIQLRNRTWYVGATRVQALGLVAMWQQGYSPEEIQTSFQALSLREVYGTIVQYLEHRDELDASFRTQEAQFRTLKAEAEARNPLIIAEIRERVARLRGSQQAPGSAAS